MNEAVVANELLNTVIELVTLVSTYGLSIDAVTEFCIKLLVAELNTYGCNIELVTLVSTYGLNIDAVVLVSTYGSSIDAVDEFCTKLLVWLFVTKLLVAEFSTYGLSIDAVTEFCTKLLVVEFNTYGASIELVALDKTYNGAFSAVSANY